MNKFICIISIVVTNSKFYKGKFTGFFIKMTKNTEYPLGEFTIKKGGNEQAGVRVVINCLKNHLGASQMANSVQVAIKGNKVVVYGDATMESLKRFEEKQNQGKIHVEFIPYQASKKNSDGPEELERLRLAQQNLQTEYQTLHGRAQTLEGQLSTANTQLAEETQLRKDTERMYTDLLRNTKTVPDKGKRKTRDLENILQQTDEFLEEQEGAIAEIMYKVADEIENRPEVSGVTQEAYENAIEDLENRERINPKYIPSEAREKAEEVWQQAEQVVSDYEKTASQKLLELPVRIARTDAGTKIILPINYKSKSGIAQMLRKDLATYSTVLKDKLDLEEPPKFSRRQPLVTLNIEGDGNYETLVQQLNNVFRESANGARLKIAPFRTNFFQGIPGREEYLSLGEYVIQRRKELGYSRQQLSERVDLTYRGLGNIETNKSTKLRHNTRTRLAKALQVPLDEIEKRIE